MATEDMTVKNESDAPSCGAMRWSLRFLFKVVLPLACIAVAVFIAMVLIKTGKKAERKKPPQQARLVTVETVKRQTLPTTVSATGTVIAAREITLTPEVAGRITSIAAEVIPGGLIQKNQPLVGIDQRDYETIVKQQESNLANAQLALKLEEGNQAVAAQEYQMLGQIVDDSEKDLVLRKPHLAQSQANLASSQAALEKAKLDVKRCTVTAPFNAVIRDKNVDLGARVSQSSSLLSLIGTDEFWIEVKAPVDQLKWLTIPQNNGTTGSAVKIYNPSVWGDDVCRQGNVIRLLGQLEEKGRRAQLLVSVKDPLCLDCEPGALPRLLIDSYVAVEIEGKALESVIAIKRDWLHDGQYVWVMDAQGKLDIRTVQTVFRNTDIIYISSGLEDGEQVVTSDISAPVVGMQLRLEGQPKKPAGTNADRKEALKENAHD